LKINSYSNKTNEKENSATDFIFFPIYVIFAHMSHQSQSQFFDPEILLWNTVVKDDEKAFEKLFGLFYPSLAIYAKRYIEDQAVQEDIVQDVFVALWESRKKLQITTSIRSYLILSVRNHCFNYLRRQGLNRQYQEFISTKQLTAAEEEDVYLLSELYDLLESALAKLPDTYRLVFEMHNMEGKDYVEIAEALNISVRTAKRYKSQVIEILREELKDYLPLMLLVYPHIIN